MKTNKYVDEIHRDPIFFLLAVETRKRTQNVDRVVSVDIIGTKDSFFPTRTEDQPLYHIQYSEKNRRLFFSIF